MSQPQVLTKQAPDVYQAVLTLNTQVDAVVEAAGLGPAVLNLIKIRASQLNGCSFCLRLHTRDALAKGETTDRLAVLSAWRDTGYFDETERAALEIVERITAIGGTEAHTERDWDPLSDRQVAVLHWAAIMINTMNRIAITNRRPVGPGPADPRHVGVTT